MPMLMQIDLEGDKSEKLAALAYALTTENRLESEEIVRTLHGPLPVAVQQDLIMKIRFLKAALDGVGEIYAQPLQE